MESIHRNSPTSALGFCSLPSELIHKILINLALPEIIRLKTLYKQVLEIIGDEFFIGDYNSNSRSISWLFVYKKRWHRDAMLHGFSDQYDRWFKIRIPSLFEHKDSYFGDGGVYLLTGSGNTFLFASKQEVFAVNLVSRSVKKIPPSPLGPRGTNLWRRSAMKLIYKSGHFKFLFAEAVNHQPILFVYDSETNTWQSTYPRDDGLSVPPRVNRNEEESGHVYLSVSNGSSRSEVMVVGAKREDMPIIFRPRLVTNDQRIDEHSIGFNLGNGVDRLLVYGDGFVLIARSEKLNEFDSGIRALISIELRELSSNGTVWEHISNVPFDTIEQIKKPYRVIMGCLEDIQGVVRVALLSNFEGLWNIIWLSYNLETSQWIWVPLPDCKMKGLNIAGIAFSSGLTLS